MPRPIEIEDLARIRYLGDPQIAPDGQRVAYVVTEVDLEEKCYRSAIWVATADGSERVRFTAGQRKDTSPRWSPDGRRLAFLSDRDGTTQLYVMPSDGGEPERLTDLKYGVADPVWSPDGAWIAFTSKVGPEGPVQQADETEEDRRRAAARSDTKVIRSLKNRLDGEGFFDERRRHIFVVSATGGPPRQITDGDWDDTQPAWSPDGRAIAFVSRRGEDRERTTFADVWVAPLDGSEPRRITPGDGTYGTPAFSPDGAWIAYTGNPVVPPYGPTTLTGLWVAPAAGGEARNLTAALDREVGSTIICDQYYAVALQRPLWLPDGSGLLVPVSDRGMVPLMRVSLDGEITAVLTGDRAVENVSLARDGRIAFLASAPTRPLEVFVAEADGSGEREVSHANDALLAEVTVVPAERISYPAEGGVEVGGWLLKPPGFDPSRRYPLILQIHGGPHGMYGSVFFHEMQVLAARGYVVLMTNPRGSTGYGQAFVSAAMGDWGGIDYRDIMAGVDYVLGLGFIDEQRLGVTGGSYGGYMTNWIVTQTDRFKAAVTQRSTCNRFSLFGTSDIAWSYSPWEFGGTPFDNPTLYLERSPITHVKNVTTPILILHSEQDLRCPIEQAEQWFAALRYLGKEAVFVRFPEESHGLSRSGRPDRRVERLRWIVDWFAEHL
ncbi:MAG: S9 family peptidase [Sphaerobacter sp.]|nr:S9 family peptidase [Sphaerobacter sp.]